VDFVGRREFLRALAAATAVGAGVRLAAGQSRPALPRTQAGGRDQLLARAGWIRVGLEKGAKSLTLAAPEGARLKPGSAGMIVLPTGGALTAVLAEGGIIVTLPTGRRVADAVFTIEPAGAGTDGAIGIGDRSYRGSLAIQTGDGGITAINEVMIDDYLRGVLPAELGGDAPVEALKAQAIAARSEVVHKLEMRRHSADGFDLCNGVHCMAYTGMKPETEVSNAAVDATTGYVLATGGKVLDAVYHNVCGGITAGAEDVWDCKPIPGLQSVLDARAGGGVSDLSSDGALGRLLVSEPANVFCSPGNPGYPSYARKYFRWTKDMDGEELERRCGVGRVRDIAVVERRPSGRVRLVRIVGERGEKTVERELPIRNLLGLWSGLFVMRTVKTQGSVSGVTFTGAGNGHGVGMCQMGAWMMAARGLKCEQILGHYYRGVQLSRIYRP
jgi:peptidoglycan hydrolase-like amidase